MIHSPEVITQYGRVTNKLDQAGSEILRYTYDPDNRLTNRWSAARLDTKYTYDPVGNLTNIHYRISGTVSFAYDGLNRMTNMVDGIGTTKYIYDGAGQLLSEDGPFASDTVTNGYSNRLRKSLSLQQPAGFWTNGFAYDITRRLTNVISPAGGFGYLYDPTLLTRHPARVTLPNTAYITNLFDENARLTATYLKNSGNTTLDSYSYVYDPANQRTNLSRADLSTVGYKYDPIGQLTIADSSASGEDRGYTYDFAWNLNWRTNNGTPSQFVVDGKNKLTSSLGNANTSDANGNMTGSYGWESLTYDDENRLTLISDNTNHTFQTGFVYDGLGRLRQRLEYTWPVPAPGPPPPLPSWQLSKVVNYIYDGWRVIQERDTNSGVPTVSYTRGNDLSGTLQGAGGIGGLLARSDGYSSGNFTNHDYYFADGNGNITYMLDASQTMVASYRYDPFGNTISSSGAFAPTNIYRFSSKEIHVNSGMYYYGFRLYDPNLQRWISRDLIAEWGGLNLYWFVRENPITLVDTLGLADGPLPNQVIPPNWPSGQGAGGLANPVRPPPSLGNPATGSAGAPPASGTGGADPMETAHGIAFLLDTVSAVFDYLNENLLEKQAEDQCSKQSPHSPGGTGKCCVMSFWGKRNGETISLFGSAGNVQNKPCCQAENDDNRAGNLTDGSYGAVSHAGYKDW